MLVDFSAANDRFSSSGSVGDFHTFVSRLRIFGAFSEAICAETQHIKPVYKLGFKSHFCPEFEHFIKTRTLGRGGILFI